eukprot:3222107-Amphidinium_carterae.1
MAVEEARKRIRAQLDAGEDPLSATVDREGHDVIERLHLRPAAKASRETPEERVLDTEHSSRRHRDTLCYQSGEDKPACGGPLLLTGTSMGNPGVVRRDNFAFRGGLAAMPAPTMAADDEWYEDEEEESKWDWWPALSTPGVQVTVPQATEAGVMLARRAAKYLETGPPSLKRRDYSMDQDNRTLREVCDAGQVWLPHDVMVALLRPFTAPKGAGKHYFRQDSP